MYREEDVISLSLTKAEAQDLFTRCLRSKIKDNEHSQSVLKKLALALDTAQLECEVA